MKLTKLLLAVGAVIIFLPGWLIYYIGHDRRRRAVSLRKPKPDDLCENYRQPRLAHGAASTPESKEVAKR